MSDRNLGMCKMKMIPIMTPTGHIIANRGDDVKTRAPKLDNIATKNKETNILTILCSITILVAFIPYLSLIICTIIRVIVKIIPNNAASTWERAEKK